jgi:methylaspartate mutase sigma subunit
VTPSNPRDPAVPSRAPVLVSGLVSDSHTWNLVYLQLLVEEQGLPVHNAGPCVPPRLLVELVREYRPCLVVLSSVNGHGLQDGLDAIALLRADLAAAPPPVVIGGNLGVGGYDAARAHTLRRAGFDGVFEGDDATDPGMFVRLLETFVERVAS